MATRTRLFIGREEITGETTAHTAAVDTVDNLKTSLVSCGRRDRLWWRASRCLFSQALFA